MRTGSRDEGGTCPYSSILQFMLICLYVLSMFTPGRRKIYIIIAISLFFFSIPGFVYMLRSPVLIITDLSFNRLYGPLRLARKRGELSRKLFRRVIPVSVAETAGADLITIAVGEASKSPASVLFPYRYLAGAVHYKDLYPDVPVFVVGGTRPRGESSLFYVRTNSKDDLYRAGLCAAFLAGDGGVLFFGDGSVSDFDWEAFREGLQDGDHTGNSVFYNASSDYSSYSSIGCVVLAGSAAKFLERNLKIPVILFSWIDPAMTPQSVKIVFDDSPWALAADAIKNFTSPEEDILVPSYPHILADRMEEKGDFRNIKGIIKANYQK